MLQKYVSSKKIIGSLISKYGVDIPFENDAIEWMGDTIEKIGYHCGFINKVETIRFNNFTVPLPCDFFTLNYILFNGSKLIHGFKRNRTQLAISSNYTEIAHLLNVRTKIIENEDLDDIDIHILKTVEAVDFYSNLTGIDDHNIIYFDDSDFNLSHSLKYIDYRLENSIHIYNQYSDEYYTDGIGCYKVSVDTGICHMFYKAFPVDSDGFPYVVDEIKYREALEWNILLNLSNRGQRFTNFDHSFIYQEASRAILKASNEHKKMTYEEMQSFNEKWTSLIR